MSDRVDGAISKNMHLTENSTLIGKTWRDFQRAAKDKKIILYGINELTHFLWLRCDENIFISAVIDNNAEKQNFTFGQLFDEPKSEEEKEIKVESREILSHYQPDDVVILISSYRYYEEIANELDEKQYFNYFSILHLEYYFREHMKENNLPYEDWFEHINNYASECANKYPIQNNKIIFSMGTYVENGKYITEQLLKLNKELDIVWVVSRLDYPAPKGVRKIYGRQGLCS